MRIKRILSLVICLVIVITAAGCGEETDNRAMNTGNNVETVLAQGMAEADDISGTDPVEEEQEEPGTEEAVVEEEPELPDVSMEEEPEIPEEHETALPSGTDGVDVDLTQLSSTMVYSEVYNMVFEPEKYIGKTVKMKGIYAVYHDEAKDKYYHACIITDATACCSQGIEFELCDDYKYPDDYPEEADDICVTGTFDIYKDGNLIQSGINSSYEQCIICDTNKDETVEFKLVLNVPTTIGNEIKGFKKEHIWSIVVEDSFGNKHAVDKGGKRHAVDTGIDYEAYRTNMTLFLLSIGMIVVIISYRLLIKHKES